MKTYLVGGYVRDKILNRKNHDKDYVVVDANASDMEKLGFKSVGKSFPVFIHKEIEGEFALARSEKKIGSKHTDFEFITEGISLKDDLSRRDFTINALALDEDGEKIIDYFGGVKDIQNKVIKPVSKAFCEDALRVLRAARFKALLGKEWKFDNKLYEYALLVKDELKFLSRERVYQETKKALLTENPEVYFISLNELCVLDTVFPWLYNLTKIEHNNEYHKEGSVFNHVMLTLKLCQNDINASWSALFHDTGKYGSYMKQSNFHIHYSNDIVNESFKEILKTLSLSKEELELSKFFALHHHDFQAAFKNSMKVSKIAKLLFKVKSIDSLKSLLIASMADMLGRMGTKNELFFTQEDLLNIYKELKSTNYEVDHKSMTKDEILSKISHKQIQIIKNYIENFK